MRWGWTFTSSWGLYTSNQTKTVMNYWRIFMEHSNFGQQVIEMEKMSKSKLWRLHCTLDHFVGLFPHCSCLTLLQEMERIFTYSNSFSFSPRGHRLLMLLTAAQHFLIQLTSPSTIYHSYRDNTNPLSVFLNRALAYCRWQSAAARALHPQIHEQSALYLTLKCIPRVIGEPGRHSLPYPFLICSN